MTTTIKPWHTIWRKAEDSDTEEGVIIHVEESTGHYWWIPIPGRDKHEKRVKHYIKAPCRAPLEKLQSKLDACEVFLVPTEYTGIKALPLASIEAMAAQPNSKDRRKLKRYLEIMHEQWRWISGLVVGNPIITLLDTETVNAYARRQAKVLGIVPTQVVHAVRAYLIGGVRQEALLPRWDSAGAPGKPRYPTSDSNDEYTKRPGRRNIAVLKGHTDLSGIVATKEVREKLHKGWCKYKTGPNISVETAYALTLGEFWAASVVITDSIRAITLKPQGELPTFDQFNRYGPAEDSTKSATRINIGQHRWDRDHRTLSGTSRDGIVAAGQCGLIDATSDDQNLVLGIDRTVAMPASSNTKVVEAWTGYFLGFYSGFERPSTMTSLLAIAHAAGSKVEFCKRYGVSIKEEEWVALHLRRIRGDNGEHKSESGINSLTAAQVTLEFVESYAAERKGPVESLHQVMHRASGHQMAGSTQGRRHKRGDFNPEKDTCRTHAEYMYHTIKAILFHNNVQRVEHLLTLEMREAKVEPTRAAILRWMIDKGYVATEAPNMAVIRAACLPLVKGVVTRSGVYVFDPRTNEERLVPGLRYRSDALDATGLTTQGRDFRQEVQVHINPNEIGQAWLRFKGLIELKLVTHDPELSELTLREWLAIVDRDRLARFLTKGLRLQILANDGIERYDSNKKARKIKKSHEVVAASEGKKRGKRMTKSEAADLESATEQRRRLGLHDSNVGMSSYTFDDCDEEVESSNEPDWVIAARARAQQTKGDQHEPLH